MLSTSATAFLIVLITAGGFVFGIIQGIVRAVQKHRRPRLQEDSRPKFERVTEDDLA